MFAFRPGNVIDEVVHGNGNVVRVEGLVAGIIQPTQNDVSDIAPAHLIDRLPGQAIVEVIDQSIR